MHFQLVLMSWKKIKLSFKGVSYIDWLPYLVLTSLEFYTPEEFFMVILSLIYFLICLVYSNWQKRLCNIKFTEGKLLDKRKKANEIYISLHSYLQHEEYLASLADEVHHRGLALSHNLAKEAATAAESKAFQTLGSCSEAIPNIRHVDLSVQNVPAGEVCSHSLWINTFHKVPLPSLPF